MCKGSISFAEKCPELLVEWDYEKNGDIRPENCSYGSDLQVYWICKVCGNNWRTSLNKRSSGRGCPECAKINRGLSRQHSAAKKNNFAENYPEIAKQWHPTKNGDKTPDMFASSSNKSAYWLCEYGHEWKISINHRTQGNGCPRCAYINNGRNFSKASAKKNIFADNYPQLHAEWHPDKNTEYNPYEIPSSSNYIVWWKCSFCDHEWQDSVNHRTNGRGCSKCSKTGTSFSEQAIVYYLSEYFPDLINRHKINGYEFDIFIPSLNVAVEYDGKYYHNSKKAFEKENNKDCFCRENGIRLIRIRDPELPKTEYAEVIDCFDTQGHNLNNAINELLTLLECNIVKSVNVATDAISIIGKYKLNKKKNSIVVTNPELLPIWHKEKNLPLIPENVSRGMRLNIWWHCDTCNQDYQQDIQHKCRSARCPICSGKRVVAGYNDLATVNPQLAAEWDYEQNKKQPFEFTAGSNERVFWCCKKCSHKWKAAIVTRNKGVGCPACSGKVPIVGKTDIATLFPELADEWHPTKNGNKTPRDYTRGSDHKAWWLCKMCENEWNATISSRVSGCGCPECGKKKCVETRKMQRKNKC